MKFHTFTLDKFQEDSINAIEKNESVVVSAPTGSGKTLIADYIIHKN
jgi:ATP-dependent RNA helicase HelY